MAQFFLAALTGVLWFLSFPIYSLDFCVWVALAPLLVAVSGTSIQRSLLLGWLAGLVGHCGAFQWIVPAIVRLEGVPLPVAAALSLAFAAYHALQFGMFGALAAWMLRGKSKVHSPKPKVGEPSRENEAQPSASLGTAVSIASAWVVLEWLFPKVFPWSLGTALSDHMELIQIVEVTGVWGLSFAIVTVNASLALAVLSWRRKQRFAWGPLALAVGLVLTVWGFGAARLKEFGKTSASGPLAISRGEREPDAASFVITTIQGNIGPGPRSILVEDQTFSSYRELTLDPSGDSAVLGLVIWPETTIRAHLHDDQHFREALFDVAEKLQGPMLVGGLDAAGHGDTEFNSLFVVSPNRTFAGVYNKRRLLPFAEMAPLPDSWWRTTGRFIGGEPPKVLAVPDTLLNTADSGDGALLIAPSICYEALSPGFFNETVREGAELLVNITDDSWFGNGNAPWQHLQGAIFRAIETRRPMVRASNSGISAIIDPSGRITARTGLFTRTVMQGAITPAHGQTLYVRWGDWFAWICALAVAAACIIRSRPMCWARRICRGDFKAYADGPSR